VSDEGSSDADVMRANEDALRNRDDELYLYDYFGPSIDTGFRVMHEANERYFPLSVEVAWALAEAAGTAVGQVQDFTFLGEYGFKGVWDGRGYPLFCIDRRWDNSFHVALRLLGSGGLVPHSISEVCRTCSAEPHWPTAAFLPKSHCEGLKRAPDPALARRTEETFATNEVAFSEAETQNLGSEQDGEESFPPAVGITEGS
jgi:hypothetical protein